MAQPPLNALRAFEAVARLGSFKAAADALCVTQSAISHQVRNFESWLGAPLFERVGNRTQLLPHGQELAQSLSLSLGEINEACQRAQASRARQALVIAAIPSVAMCWLIPRLTRFKTAHPDIETRIIYAMHGRDIDFRDVHLAFGFAQAPLPVPHVWSDLFLSGDSIPVCSPAVAQRLEGAADAAALMAMGLLHDGDTTGWTRWFAHMALEMPRNMAGATFEDFNLLRTAALSGQGVALCALEMVRPDIASGTLVALSQVPIRNGFDYYLFFKLAGPMPMQKHIDTFRDWALADRDQPVES